MCIPNIQSRQQLLEMKNMAKYVSFKLISAKDERIYLKGTVNIDTIDDDEPEFEFEQNDGTYNSQLPYYWKTNGEDLSDAFGIFTQTIDYEMLNQFLADFADDNVTINFYGNILIINDGKDKSTTIRLKESTKIRLNNIGERGESFDDIINRLLNTQ